jgi:protein-disulfide isomerase
MRRLFVVALLVAGFGAATAAGPVRQATGTRRTADPTVTYAVPLGASPSLGSPKAKVTMIMAYEFACPFCRRAWDTVEALRAKYGSDLRVVYKQLIVHKDRATPAALAACAAHQQGRWRPMAELLWTKAFDVKRLDQANIDALVVEVGLDPAQYQRDIAGVCKQELAADLSLLKRFAVTATPTFFINGRYLAGAQDIAAFEKLIEEEIARADVALKRGVRPEKLYETEILGKGVSQIP